MSVKQWLGAALLVTASGLVMAAGQDKALQTTLKRYVDAIQNYDQAQLEDVLAADYIEVSPVGEIDERQKMIGFYDAKVKAEMSGRTPAIALSEIQTREYGEIAVSIAKLQFDMKAAEGNVVSRAMRVTFVSKKIGSDWKISSSQFTSIKPATKP